LDQNRELVSKLAAKLKKHIAERDDINIP